MGVLYARVGGAWVPVVGTDEVWIATDPPTDQATELWYDTDDPGIGDLSKLPRGFIGMASGTGGQTGLGSGGSITDFTGCAVTWTADPTRRYKLTLWIPGLLQQSAAGNQRVALRDGSNNLLTWSIADITVASGYLAHHISYVISGVGPGSYTVKGGVACFGGNCNVTAGFLPLLIVEDIGGV